MERPITHEEFEDMTADFNKLTDYSARSLASFLLGYFQSRTTGADKIRIKRYITTMKGQKC